MTTKVHSYLGGLGIDATNKFTLASNATVTVGNGTATGNVHVGGNMSIGNISPGAHDLAIAGTASAAGLVVPDGQFTLGSTAVTSNASELNFLDAITRGSIIYGNASAATARLAKGAEGTVLTAGADDISWAALEAGVGYQNSSTSTVPGTTNTDLGNLTDASQDAFGIASSTKYDLMDPIGSLVSLDLGAF